jgi:hypothetical protein
VRPIWVSGGIVVVVLASTAVSAASAVPMLGWWLVHLSLLVAFATAWALVSLTRPLATQISGRPRTVGDLARAALIDDVTAWTLDRRWSYDEVLDRVRAISAEQFGADPHSIGPDTRYVEDLNMD